MSGYLVYYPDMKGRMSLVWSKTPISEALLEAIPSKAVPEFKYKTNNGNTQLVTNIQDDKKRFYQGFVSFVKAARSYDSSIKLGAGALQAPLPFQVVFLTNKNTLMPVTEKSTPLTTIVAVAAIQRDSSIYKVKTLDRSLFISQGNQSGGAADVLDNH